jgi:cytochrome c-type biogenesis protein CcmH/NrfF
MSRSNRLAGVAAVTAAALVFGAAAAAQQDDPVAWGYAMAHDLMSPFCPGRTLSQCTSPQAAELRQWIILQAAAGASRAEVEQILLDRYGDSMLQAPKAAGWGAFAYAIPIVFFFAGGFVVYWLIRRLSSPDHSTPANVVTTGPALDPELERLVEEELQRG